MNGVMVDSVKGGRLCTFEEAASVPVPQADHTYWVEPKGPADVWLFHSTRCEQ